MASPIDADIDGRAVRLTNLDKVLYPSGFTKAEVVDYYARIAQWIIPHLAGRCITFRRFPDGTDKDGFFEKRCPTHRPDWVPVALGPGDRRGGIEYCRIEEPAAIVWAANLAAIELHAPMALAADLDTPRTLVFDFDPGPKTSIVECCEVAIGVRTVLDSVGLQGWCKTSGSKGLQLYVPLNTPGVTHEAAADFALAVGQLMERQMPGRVTTVMAKVERPGKVFVDWSQNALHKTTIAPVLAACSTRSDRVDARDVGRGRALRRRAVSSCASRRPTCWRRVDELGDLFAPVLTLEQRSADRLLSRAVAALIARGVGAVPPSVRAATVIMVRCSAPRHLRLLVSSARSSLRCALAGCSSPTAESEGPSDRSGGAVDDRAVRHRRT